MTQLGLSMYKKIAYILLTVCSGIMVIAAHYDTIDTRNPDSQETYGRLLSNAYKVILNHEKIYSIFCNSYSFCIVYGVYRKR